METEQNIPAGTKLDGAGKLRYDNGKLVDKATAEQLQQGNIILNFDIESLRKKRQQKNGKAVDLVAGLRSISPAIELLKVGVTAKVPIGAPEEGKEKGSNKRAFLMGIVTKLNNLTKAGAEWAGRTYECAADEEGEFVYVVRGPDGEPKARKVGVRGAGKKTQPLNRLETAMDGARRHLYGDGGSEEGSEEGDEDDDKDVSGEDAVSDPAIVEDATVVHVG